MKNTLENKERFFGHYMNQNVLSHPSYKGKTNCLEPSLIILITTKNDFSEYFLLLKSLSDITDEDAIEVSKIYNPFQCLDYELHLSRGRKIVHKNNRLSIHCIDYLRLKGYAVPYMGLSVETLIEYGWVKIKV